MRELISIASMFLLLAFAGIERGHAEITKSCRSGAIEQLLGAC
jgi:hypothetical protein